MDFELQPRDRCFSARVLCYPLIESLNAAFIEVSTDEMMSKLVSDDSKEKILAGRNSDKKEIFIRNGMTDKFCFVLAEFAKVLLLAVRSVDEEESITDSIFNQTSEFLKSVLNATSNQVDSSVDAPQTDKILEDVIDETATIVSRRFPLSHPADTRRELEDLKLLLKENIRFILTLIIGMGVCVNDHSMVEFCRLLILLASKLVVKRKIAFGMMDDAEDDDSDDDSDNNCDSETDE